MRKKNFGFAFIPLIPWIIGIGLAGGAMFGGYKVTDSLTQETAGLPMWGWVAIIIVVIMVLFRRNESSQGNIIIYDDD